MSSKETPDRSGVFLCLEFLLLFGVAPLLVLAARRPGVLFLLLWLGAVVTYRLSHVPRPAVPLEPGRIMRRLSWVAPLKVGILLWLFSGERSEAERQAARTTWRIVLRFLVCGAALTLVTDWLAPGLFLSLPRAHPVFWAAIMVLYPLLSVWPQEVIFRRFLFYRYVRIFGEGGGRGLGAGIRVRACDFSERIAVALTVAGGAMFARNYARKRVRCGSLVSSTGFMDAWFLRSGWGGFFILGLRGIINERSKKSLLSAGALAVPPHVHSPASVA